MDVKDLVINQRNFFQSGKTKNIKTRKQVLIHIKEWIINNEDLIIDALKKDLNKSATESYMCEIGMVLSELNYQLKHIKKWSQPHKVLTPLAQFHSVSYETYEPYGVVLVMSPWNYPFMLALEPAIGAIAAGNTVIIKPSEHAPHTSYFIKKMINETCNPNYVSVVEGGINENTILLDQRFDYIFFTGSVNVGKIIMEKASHFLTPVTLELGGKSPCIINDVKDMHLVAKRIAFGKFINSGQTCVAPDYVLIHQNLKNEFIEEMLNIIHEFFGDSPLDNSQLVRIVNEKHFQRLISLLDNQNIVIGGQYDTSSLSIEPTIVDDVDSNNVLMKEEIFGPILPIISYTNIQNAIDFICSQEKPLACYIFTHRKDIENYILDTCSFGGGCINDTVIHLATNHLGFGGVGYSGIGSYHGKKSFDTFSHTRSIVKKSTWIDLPLRYYPYTNLKDKLIRFFVK